MAKLSDLIGKILEMWSVPTAQLLPGMLQMIFMKKDWGLPNVSEKSQITEQKIIAISFKCLRAVQCGKMTRCLLHDFGKRNLRERDDRVSTVVVSGMSARMIAKSISEDGLFSSFTLSE